MRRFSPLAAIAVLLTGCSGSTSAHSDRASQDRNQAILAVAAYNTSAYGREIQLVGLDGKRIRIDPHPPMPIDGAWSPDGTRIAFSGAEGPSYALGSRNIYTMNGRGSDVRLVYAGPAPTKQYAEQFVPTWSPDGKWLAFSVDGRGPWIVRADGRGARRLADLVVESGSWIAWSPDGRALAVAGQDLKNNAEFNVGVYTVSIDGTTVRRLTRPLTRNEVADETSIFDVTWAPNGKRIAYTRYSDSASASTGADEIDVVSANGHNERRVDRGDCPVWSPDGQRLAYWTAGGGIAVVRPGGPPRLVVKQKHAGCPAWVADGHRIVYFAAGTPYIANADTTAVRKPSAAERKHVRLAQDSGQTWSKDGKFLDVEGDFDLNWQIVRILTLHGTAATFRWSDDYSPVWSPDGRKLAFVRIQKAEQIFILDTVRKRLHRLAAGTNPAWSSDGNWIAFERKNEIFVVPARGGVARPIGKGHNPVWSPDSRSVAATGGGLFVMSRDGERRRRIDRGAGESCGGGAELPNDRPAWSHDGRMLAFDYWCEADQADELAVVGSDGTLARVVAQGASPQWSPDDTRIAFIGDSGLASKPVAGGSARVLASRVVKSFTFAPDGRLVAYTLDIPSKVGTEIWLVQTDGTNRRPLLQGGSDSEPAWRP